MKISRLTHTKHFRVTPALHAMLSDIAAKSHRHESDLILFGVRNCETGWGSWDWRVSGSSSPMRERR